jgi:hypothetical protein
VDYRAFGHQNRGFVPKGSTTRGGCRFGPSAQIFLALLPYARGTMVVACWATGHSTLHRDGADPRRRTRTGREWRLGARRNRVRHSEQLQGGGGGGGSSPRTRLPHGPSEHPDRAHGGRSPRPSAASSHA